MRRPGRIRYNVGLAGLGLELLAAVLGLTLLGVWIDRRMGSAPWGVLVCATIGVVGGLYNLVRSASRAARKSAASRAGDDGETRP